MLNLYWALFLATHAVFSTDGFSIIASYQKARSSISIPLRVIKADDTDFDFDPGAGGVALAETSVIKITGTVQHKPGSASPNVKELIRYREIQEVKEDKVNQILSEHNARIIATGQGKEMYFDPGETVEARVTLAPHDAVRDSLAGAGSAMEYPTIVLNFAGGDDAQVSEVLNAVEEIVLDLDVATRAKIIFNSISHSMLPPTSSYLTVIGLPEEVTTGGLRNVDRAVASGEVYFANGKYYTVIEEDINPALV